MIDVKINPFSKHWLEIYNQENLSFVGENKESLYLLVSVVTLPQKYESHTDLLFVFEVKLFNVYYTKQEYSLVFFLFFVSYFTKKIII
jgi:hypothetical protein